MYSKEKLVEGFLQYLQLQNYDKTSLDNAPKRIAEFLDFMHERGATTIDQMDGELTNQFLELSKNKEEQKNRSSH